MPPLTWCEHYWCILAFRKVEPANVAHHRFQGCCSCGFHIRCRRQQRRRALREHGHLHYRDLRRQQSNSWLVQLRLWTDQGEESRCNQHGHHDYEHQFHLDSLSLDQGQ